MKTKTNKLLLGVLCIAALGFNSCKKEETPVTKVDSYNTNLQSFKKSAEKQAVATQIYYVMGAEILPDLISSTRQYMKTRDWDCAIITVDSSVMPHIATIDFGGGCTDSKGRNFSGVINISYTDADLGNPGCIINANFDHFVMDSFSLNGTMSYRNDGPNGSGNEVGSLTFNTEANFSMDQVRLNGITTLSFEWVSARNTAFIDVTGDATDANGVQFTTSTSVLIENRQGCENYVKGTMLIQSPSFPDEEIDYGSGICDDQATSTVNGNVTTFTLR